MIGTIFQGKVKTFHRQWVETKFFIFILPIYPVQSMFVTGATAGSRSGMLIEPHRQSIIAGYLRVPLLVATILFFIAGINGATPALITAVVLLAATVYFGFFFGRCTEREKVIRNRIGAVTGIYAMPEWLELLYMAENMQHLVSVYFQDYASDWQSDIHALDVPVIRRDYLYVLALFHSKLHPGDAADFMLHKMEELCEQTKVVKMR